MRFVVLLSFLLVGCATTPTAKRLPASQNTQLFAITWNNNSGNFGSCMADQDALGCAKQDCAGDCNEVAYCRMDDPNRLSILISGVKRGPAPHYTDLICIDSTQDSRADAIARGLKNCADLGYQCVETIFPQ